MRGHAGGMGSTNEGHAPMKKGSLLAPFALPLTAYFFVGCFKSDSSREALKKATREERGLGLAAFFLHCVMSVSDGCTINTSVMRNVIESRAFQGRCVRCVAHNFE